MDRQKLVLLAALCILTTACSKQPNDPAENTARVPATVAPTVPQAPPLDPDAAYCSEHRRRDIGRQPAGGHQSDDALGFRRKRCVVG